MGNELDFDKKFSNGSLCDYPVFSHSNTASHMESAHCYQEDLAHGDW